MRKQPLKWHSLPTIAEALLAMATSPVVSKPESPALNALIHLPSLNPVRRACPRSPSPFPSPCATRAPGAPPIWTRTPASAVRPTAASSSLGSPRRQRIQIRSSRHTLSHTLGNHIQDQGERSRKRLLHSPGWVVLLHHGQPCLLIVR